MSRFLEKLTYAAADIIYYLQGCPVAVGRDGAVRPSGRIGAFLLARDEKRFHRLTYRMERTATGRALMEFIRDARLQIKFDHAMGSPAFGKGGGYYAGSVIVLNTRYTDDMLLGILAHEARHAWQKTKRDRVLPDGQTWLPPEASLVINRIMEADAFAFEQKFLEDYAAVTGNRRPLRLLYDAQNTQSPEKGDDMQNFMFWYDLLIRGQVYDGRRIETLKEVAEQRHRGKAEMPDVPPSASDALIVAAARAIDIVWPLSAGESHYLSPLTDAQLTAPSMKAVHPFLTIAFNGVKERYAEQYAQRKMAPPVKAEPFFRKIWR